MLRGMRQPGSIACVALLLLVVCSCSEPPPPPPVADAESKRTLAQGETVGFAGRYGNHVWLGLPFAKPPTGDLRWRAPQQPEPWTGTREALAAGSACPQFASPLGGVEAPVGTVVGSEDCLYLNVYAPRFAAGRGAEGRRAPARDALDPRRRQHDRGGGVLRRRPPRGVRERDRRGDELPPRPARLAPPPGDLREGADPPRPLRQLRHARSRARARVDPGQRRGFRRRSGARHDLRRVGGRAERALAADHAAREGSIPPRRRAERRAHPATLAQAREGVPDRRPGRLSHGLPPPRRRRGSAGSRARRRAEDILRAYPGDKGIGMFNDCRR